MFKKSIKNDWLPVLGLNNKPNRYDTISLIANQLHDTSDRESVLDSFLLANGAMIRRKTDSDLLAPIANQWVCNPVYGFIFSGIHVHVGTGISFLPKTGKYFLETSWGWGKYRSLSLQSYSARKKMFINADKPVYVFSGVGYHGLVEDLSAILMLQDIGINFNIVISPHNQWMLKLLQVFKSSDTKIILCDPKYWVGAPRTIVTTKSAFGEFVNPIFISLLNKAGSELNEKCQSKKIFISRTDSRKRRYEKEEELEKRYVEQGYESVRLSDMPVRDQISLFKYADGIAGLHGAGFVNLVWSMNPINVTEYYHRNHFNSCYSALCEYLGHNYSCMALT